MNKSLEGGLRLMFNASKSLGSLKIGSLIKGVYRNSSGGG